MVRDVIHDLMTTFDDDEGWREIFLLFAKDIDEECLSPDVAGLIWRIGLLALKEMREAEI